MTRKKLKLDALQVDSFEMDASAPAARGTVQAHIFNRDINHDDSNALVCGTNGYNYCAAETYACVSYTGGKYEITPLCTNP